MVSSALFFFSVIVYLIFSLGIFRIVVRRSYRLYGRLKPGAVVLQGSVFFSWGALTWADLPPHWPFNPILPALRIVGWFFMVVGLVTMVGLIGWFDLRVAAGWKVTSLSRRGPYAITRNPQLLACILAAFGYVLLWLSWHSIGWLVVLMIVAHIMVLTEEEHLRMIFGIEYQEYYEQVPRYLRILPRRN